MHMHTHFPIEKKYVGQGGIYFPPWFNYEAVCLIPPPCVEGPATVADAVPN